MSGEPVHEAPASTPEERNSAAAAHMAPFVGSLLPFFGSFVVTLAVWWLRRESVFVEQHARASINFQLSMTLYYGLALGYVYVYVGFGLVLCWRRGYSRRCRWSWRRGGQERGRITSTGYACNF